VGGDAGDGRPNRVLGYHLCQSSKIVGAGRSRRREAEIRLTRVRAFTQRRSARSPDCRKPKARP